MLFQECLASLSIGPFLSPSLRVCVPDCHRNRVESSTAEKVLFFSVGGKEFTVAEGIVKVQVGINLRKCVSDRI